MPCWRFRPLPLQVVFVEEAGEVFESHVLACLVPGVEQLVLIGGWAGGSRGARRGGRRSVAGESRWKQWRQ